MKHRRWDVGTAAFVSLCFVFSSTTSSQTTPPLFPQRDKVPEFVSFFAPFFLPKIIQDEYQLKDYICSPDFAEFKTQYGDVYAIDAIFDRAMRLSWNNAYEALLISCLATMEHMRFGIRLPLVGPLLWVPLTSEFEDDFRERVNALPRKLYPDTPPGPAGDRDKLQHFFGSAFLTYMFESRASAERTGEFIEWGEDAVVVDGALDERDFRANRQGQEFGLRLLEDKNILPSPFLKFALAQSDSGSGGDTMHSVDYDMEKK